MIPCSNASPTLDQVEEKQQRNMKKKKNEAENQCATQKRAESKIHPFSCNILKLLPVKIWRSSLRVMLITALSF